MPNKWITFLAGFRKSHPKLSMKEAMRQGAVAYRKSKGKGKSTEPAAPKRRRRRKKKAL